MKIKRIIFFTSIILFVAVAVYAEERIVITQEDEIIWLSEDFNEEIRSIYQPFSSSIPQEMEKETA